MESEYQPSLSNDEIAKRKAIQDEIYGRIEPEGGETQVVNIAGKDFVILPGVFPAAWTDSALLAEVVQTEAKAGERVLDLGTGPGVQGIMAAERGAKVVAADINPKSVECAKLNAEKHGVSKSMEFIVSDLFSELGDARFDLVIFNPPFRWFEPRDMSERATTDEGFVTLRQFFQEARDHLENDGRILMVYSDSGDVPYFESLINENNYQLEVIAERESESSWQYKVYRLQDIA